MAETAPPTGYRMPKFRVAHGGVTAALPEGQVLRLVADQDFPPFSFIARTGEPAGLAVELATAACAEMKVRCSVSLKPLAELLPALVAREADVVLAGPRIADSALDGALMTRPWFRSMARFATQSGSPLPAIDAGTLSGKRIAVVKDTVHARWLETYYGDAEILTFDSEDRAQTALRTGEAELLFGDNLRLIYWVSGSSSGQCCRLLGGAVSDFDAFSRNFAFLVRDDLPAAVDILDAGLDRLQENGTTERIFNVYVPLAPW